jgi:hypothetical protein
MEIFLFYEMGKKEVRELKESGLSKGKFSYSCVLLRFGNTLWENARVWEPPLQQKALLSPRGLAFYPNSLG